MDPLTALDDQGVVFVLSQIEGTVDSPFLEEPVSIETFILSKEYGNQPAAWSAIREELKGIFGEGGHQFANQEAILCWAIGAGKSFLVSMAFTYMVYWLLNLKDPQRYFRLAPGTPIVLLNQSINEPQAKRVVFHEVAQRIAQAPWFKAHRFEPDPQVTSELRFPKNIVIFPGSSKVTFPAGYAIFAGVIDEAAWFTEPIEGSERQDPAQVIYDNILYRIVSRFGSRGLLLAISNPKHADDFIEQKFRFVKWGDPERGIPPGEQNRMYASRKAIWDTKPGPEPDATGGWKPWNFVPFTQVQSAPDGTVQTIFRLAVPDVYLSEFRRDPETAKRNRAAIATRTGIGYFWDPEVVNRPGRLGFNPGFNPQRRHPYAEDDTGTAHLAPWFAWPHEKRGVCHAHLDMSVSRDATGIAVGHVEEEVLVAGERKPLVVVDLMLELRVPQGAQIDFQEVANLLYAIRDRGFPLKYVTFDGFQSVMIIQQLNKRQIEAEVLSVDRDATAYDTMRDTVYEARLDYYQYQPFYDCVRSLMWDAKRRKVDHTVIGKKDVSDAVAGICQTLTERWMVDRPPSVGQVRSPATVAVMGTPGIARRGVGRRAVVAS